MQHNSGRLLTLAGFLFIAVTTLVPLPQLAASAAATPIWCLVCGPHGGVDVVVNVLLFLPFAVGLRLAGLSTRRVIATGMLVSLTIECLQFTLISGRDASLSDLLTNTLGSTIGAVLGSRLRSLVLAQREQAASLAKVGGAAWLAIQAGTGFLLQPWIPPHPVEGKWSGTNSTTWFDGRVTSAFLSGAPVPGDSRDVDSELRASISQGRVHLELGVISGEGISGWASVFELMGAHGPVMAVQAVGTDLAFRAPSRTYGFRLRGPALRLEEALPSTPGKALRLSAGERHHTLWATSTSAGVGRSRSLVLSPSFGWSLVVPFTYAYGPEVHWVTGLWLAGLLLPVGYWCFRSGPNRYRQGSACAALLLTGLGLVPLLEGYPPVHWSEWLAGAVGLGFGWAGQPAAAYFTGRCASPSIRESC